MTIRCIGKALAVLALMTLLSAPVVFAQEADATSSASTTEETQQAQAAPSGLGTILAAINFYDLALGPLFIAAWVLFGLGFLWRIYRFTRLTTVVPRPPSAVLPRMEYPIESGSFLHRARRWEKRSIFGTNPMMARVNVVFHVLLFLVPLLLPAHADLLAKSVGAHLPTLPAGFLDVMTLALMVLGGFFLLRRILVPRVRVLTTLRDYVILLLVAAPFVSAYMAHHQWLNYHTVVLVHMLIGDLVIACVPWTKLGHMPFFILARFFVRGEYAIGRGSRRWAVEKAK